EICLSVSLNKKSLFGEREYRVFWDPFPYSARDLQWGYCSLRKLIMFDLPVLFLPIIKFTFFSGAIFVKWSPKLLYPEKPNPFKSIQQLPIS
ncbi:hypothetical protein, partial [Vibrio parahaemolyticus]|uniref:hypothetical protein n=1 Tax=Vibrio parahaemolyticus TaxID=670 RepID=UPI001C60666B